jgi:hypothetical protein
MAAAKLGVFLKQAFLQVVAKALDSSLSKPFARVASGGNLFTWPLAYSTSYRVLPLYWGLCPEFGRPDFFGFEALGKLHVLPQSDLASPGALTCWRQNWVRRSALPNAPSFSIHMADGKYQVGMTVTRGVASDTTMKLSGLRQPG